MDIPHTRLSADALRAVIEEFVTREGTEYGLREYSLEEKIRHVMAQLESGKVRIDFDAGNQSCNLVAVEAPDGDRQSRREQGPETDF